MNRFFTKTFRQQRNILRSCISAVLFVTVCAFYPATAAAQVTTINITAIEGTVTTKVYDGNTVAAVTLTKVSWNSSNNFSGDITNFATGNIAVESAVFDNANAGSGKVVTVTLKRVNSWAGPSYEDGTGFTQTLTGDITKATLTIVANTGVSTPKTYDGTRTVAITSVGFHDGTNPVNLQTSEYTVEGRLSTTNVNVGTTKSVQARVTALLGNAANNYQMSSYTSWTNGVITGYTVLPKQIAINGVITPVSKTYDATTAATVTDLSFSGIVEGESLASGTDYNIAAGSTYASPNAAAEINVSVTATLDATSTKAKNYVIANGGIGTIKGAITKQALVASGGKSGTKVYDGNDEAEVTDIIFTPAPAGGALTAGVDYEVDAYYTNKNASSSTKITRVTDIRLISSLALQNYTVSSATPYQRTGTNGGRINKRSIDITGGTIASKTYDKTNSVAVTGLSFSNTIEPFTSANYTISSAVFSGSNFNAGSGKTVRITGITLVDDASSGVLANTNYELSSINYNLTGQTINQRHITVDAGSGVVADKVYDGGVSLKATVTNLTFSNTVSSDDFVAGTDYTVAATFSDKNAGVGKTVTVTGVTLLNTPTANNYILDNPAPNYAVTGGGTIQKKPISITGGTTAPKIYDKTTSATVTGLTFSGLIPGENLAINTDYAINSGATYSSAYAGTRTVTLTANLVSSPKANNYLLTNGLNYQLSGQIIGQAVLKKEYLSVVLPAPTVGETIGWLYYDEKTHPATVTLINGYTLNGSNFTVKYNGDVNPPYAPGEYTVTVTIDGGGNFQPIVLEVGKFIIYQPANPPNPVVRSVTIPSVPGVTTDPIANEYKLYSGSNFEFTILPPVNGIPKVTTGRESDKTNGVVVTGNVDGSYTVLIRDVRVNIVLTITIDPDLTGGGDTNGNETVTSNRVWASGNSLHILSTGAGQAQIYALTGALVKTLTVSTGENIERLTLPRGIYVVKLAGKSYKVLF